LEKSSSGEDRFRSSLFFDKMSVQDEIIMNLNFLKTIRFKLTLWYSLLLLVVCFFFVLFANIIITRHFLRDPIEGRQQKQIEKVLYLKAPGLAKKWKTMSDKQRELVREFRKGDLKQIRQVSIFSFIPLTIMSFGGGYLIAGQMLKPIQDVNNQINTITAQNLGKQIKYEDVGDEISRLAGSFNKMSGRLAEGFELQKQFVENASHELKTPLAVVQINLEAAIAGGKKKDLEEAAEIALKSSKFMNRLIEDLLLLSLLDRQVEMEEVDLNIVVKNAVEQSKVLAKDKEVELLLKSNEKDLKIMGNSTLLQRAIGNLIDNAVKHSGSGSAVDIELKKEAGKIMISVKDRGEGISKEHLNRIFERFYRVDKSRSRDVGGFGLGLAIVKRIVELHGGNVSVSSVGGVGSEFVIGL